MPARRAASSLFALSLPLFGALAGCGGSPAVTAAEDVDLGPLYVGHAQTKVITITNSTGSAQRFKPLAFLAGGGTGLTLSSTCVAPLAHGASCDLTLQVTPGAAGPIRAEVFVFGDRSDVVALDAAARLGALERALEAGDQHFVVHGDVQEAVLLKASEARLAFERDNDVVPFPGMGIEFKNVGVETSRQAPGTVVEGDLASRFEVRACKGPIAPGQSCSITVFPKNDDLGDLEGTLTISGSPVKVSTKTKERFSPKLLPALTTKDLFGVEHVDDRILAVGAEGTVLSAKNGKWKVEPNVGTSTLRLVSYTSVPETSTYDGKPYTREGATSLLMFAGDDGAFISVDGAAPKAVTGIAPAGIPVYGNATYGYWPDIKLRASGYYTRSDGRTVGFGADGVAHDYPETALTSLSAHGFLGGSVHAWAAPGGHLLLRNYAAAGGTSERTLELGENVTLHAIDRGYAVGDKGLIYRTSLDGDWVALPSGTTKDLRTISTYGESTIIAGDGVVLLEKADKTFRVYEVPASLRAATWDGSSLLFVGDKGAIVHFP